VGLSHGDLKPKIKAKVGRWKKKKTDSGTANRTRIPGKFCPGPGGRVSERLDRGGREKGHWFRGGPYVPEMPTGGQPEPLGGQDGVMKPRVLTSKIRVARGASPRKQKDTASWSSGSKRQAQGTQGCTGEFCRLSIPARATKKHAKVGASWCTGGPTPDPNCVVDLKKEKWQAHRPT